MRPSVELARNQFLKSRPGAMAIGGVGLALFIFFLEQAGVVLPIPLIVFGSMASLVMIGYGIYGYFQFPTRSIAASLAIDPTQEFLSAQLGVAKAFMKEERRLGTGIAVSDPPSHPKQFKLIQDTQREVAKLNQALGDRLSETDWESLPFRQWMHRVEALSKSPEDDEKTAIPRANSQIQRPPLPTRPDNALLVEQLTGLLADGLRLLENWLDMGSGVMPRGPITTAEDVDFWEWSVRELLKTARPLHFVMFTKDLPPLSLSDSSITWNPDRRRLFERVRALEAIIVGIRGY